MTENEFYLKMVRQLLIGGVALILGLTATCSGESAYRNHLVATADNPLAVACATSLTATSPAPNACMLVGREP